MWSYPRVMAAALIGAVVVLSSATGVDGINWLVQLATKLVDEEYAHLAIAVAFGVAIGFLIPCVLEALDVGGMASAAEAGEEAEEDSATVTVLCLPNKSFNLPVSLYTTCAQVVQEVCKLLMLGDSCRNSFALFIRNPQTGDHYIDETKPSLIIPKLLEKTEEKDSQVVFKVFEWMEPDLTTLQVTERNFIFEQVLVDYLGRHFKLDDSDLITLAALCAQYRHRDYNAHAPQELKVHPAHLDNKFSAVTPTENAKRQQIANIHSNRVKGRAKARKVRSLAMSEEETRLLDIAICEAWKRLKGCGEEKALRRFMNIVSECPEYGNSEFRTTQTKEKHWPKHVRVRIDRAGVSYFDEHKGVLLDSFSYIKVASFGAPEPCQFHLVTQGHRTIVVDTLEAVCICRLIKGYLWELTGLMSSETA